MADSCHIVRSQVYSAFRVPCHQLTSASQDNLTRHIQPRYPAVASVARLDLRRRMFGVAVESLEIAVPSSLRP